jgi:hypothetical protein
MLNHGLYTGTLWSVPVTFVDAAGDPVDMSGIEYFAEVFADGVPIFVFRSSGAAADEGEIDTASAADGVLTFTATQEQHAAVPAGLYRLHLLRDLADDVWTAEGTLLIGEPGDRETYLRMDLNRTREVNAAVYLPIIVGGGGVEPDFPFDGGNAATDYFGLQVFDFGSATGPSDETIDLGSAI